MWKFKVEQMPREVTLGLRTETEHTVLQKQCSRLLQANIPKTTIISCFKTDLHSLSMSL